MPVIGSTKISRARRAPRPAVPAGAGVDRAAERAERDLSTQRRYAGGRL